MYNTHKPSGHRLYITKFPRPSFSKEMGQQVCQEIPLPCLFGTKDQEVYYIIENGISTSEKIYICKVRRLVGADV